MPARVLCSLAVRAKARSGRARRVCATHVRTVLMCAGITRVGKKLQLRAGPSDAALEQARASRR
eukprot:7230333-Alexandrium_andersonii.AAC.1